MPDDSDYVALGALLARPHTWTEDETEYVLQLRGTQAQVLASAHPKDRRSRERLRSVLAEIDVAVEARRASES